MPVSIVDGRARSVPSIEEAVRDLEHVVRALGKAGEELLALALSGQTAALSAVATAAAMATYDEEPVDLDTFLFDDEYLGAVGRTLYPKWVDDLHELFEGDYHEVILTGGIGIGKNTVAAVIVARLLYEILCMRNPQAVFGLESKSEIAVPCISLTEQLAKRVVLFSIRQKILQSPWFVRNYFPDGGESEMRFTRKSVRVFGSGVSLGGVLSTNAVAAVVDEANFMGGVPSSVRKIRYGGARGKNVPQSFAETIYLMLRRRIKSRFERYGRVPGKLIVISSAGHEGSFVERRIRETLGEPGVFVRQYAVWDVKPAELFSPKRFWVFLSKRGVATLCETEEERDSFLRSAEAHGDEYVSVEAPVDFLEDFKKDIEGALQDLAGVSFLSAGVFIRRRDAIVQCIDESRKHPAAVETWIADEKLTIYWSMITERKMLRDRRGRPIIGRNGKPVTVEVPRVNPQAPRYVHVDTAQSQDAVGVCIAHVAGITDVVRRDQDGEEYVERAPVIYVDFLLRIKAPPGGEVILADVRKLLYRFMAHGFDIRVATTDQFQSLEFRQYLERQKGVETRLLSVDRTSEPYRELRSAIYDGRVSYYRYGPLIGELASLVWDEAKGKVDHPEGGSKDVSDALAGVVFSLTQDYDVIGPVLPVISRPTGRGPAVKPEPFANEGGSGSMGASEEDDLLPVLG